MFVIGYNYLALKQILITQLTVSWRILMLSQLSSVLLAVCWYVLCSPKCCHEIWNHAKFTLRHRHDFSEA